MRFQNKEVSEFEKAVYKAVMLIPSGKTQSYGWVARYIGRPNAARAVGNALNKNPFAPRVPCHRVIRSDGSLGGFKYGLSKKRRLLSSEGLIRRRRN